MLEFYKNKKVFVTGHTGFKGAWLSKMLINAGAEVTGFSLRPSKAPNLFELSGIEENIESIIGDIRDLDKLKDSFNRANPEIAIHLAAQPIVRDSYVDPHYTYETNVMGTVNFLECVRQGKRIKSVLNVTTDKVYLNKEWEWGYRECDELDGFDPYSNSKSCSELVTHSYNRAYFNDKSIRVSTARAGNVIGGGDFAKDRIIPDCIRAAQNKQDIIIRNPYSTRPYQHVLEPLNAYLMILKKQYENDLYTGYFNVGPGDEDCVSTGKLVDLFCKQWGDSLSWVNKHDGGPHEAKFLKLDCSLFKTKFNWKPRWHIDKAVGKTIEWTKAYLDNKDISQEMDKQIRTFMKEGNEN